MDAPMWQMLDDKGVATNGRGWFNIDDHGVFGIVITNGGKLDVNCPLKDRVRRPEPSKDYHERSTQCKNDYPLHSETKTHCGKVPTVKNPVFCGNE